jgi:tripartite-type tricarboxylate transporter receptor subunit TctC
MMGEHMKRRQFLATALASMPTLLSARWPAQAQSPAWPTRLVKFVVPTTAGGGSDIALRLLTESLARRWGQSVIVDNRPGANAIVGTDFVAKSAPDGCTILCAAPTLVQNVALGRSLPYNVTKDLVPVTQMNRQQYAILAARGVPGDSLPSVLENAKAARRSLNFASVGLGSTGHLIMEKMKRDTHSDIVHVPYRGSPELVRAMVSGECDLGLVDVQTAFSYISDGSTKMVAVTGPKRLAVRPDVPTLAEAGISGFEGYNWVGLFVPTGTPAAVVAKIATDIRDVQADPAIAKRLTQDLMVEPTGTTPEEFRQIFEQDLTRWTELVHQIGVRAD